MATEVIVPAMGESITTGIIAAWHVADGAYVDKEQVLYELETDKITSEATAEVAGTISLKAAEGDEVEIGQVVALIDESAAKPGGGDTSQSEAETTAEPVAAAPHTAAPPISPAVRRIAAETGTDANALAPGSGKGGRITKGDILASHEKKVDAPSPATPATTDQGSRVSRHKMTPLRKKIAQRLVQATNEAALLTTFNEVDMSSVMALRKRYQEDFVSKHGVKLGFMSFFVKAVVHALQEVPELNTQIDGDYFIQNHFYDIGVAVGSEKGLMVPVVRDCDSKGFADVETSIIEYAKKARSGKITLDDLMGGVFTISNGGIYGSMLSTPLLNMPQVGILGLHNITQRAVVIDGQIVARPMMYLALSYDHRAVDGKGAVTFLIKIKNAIENPERMLFSI